MKKKFFEIITSIILILSFVYIVLFFSHHTNQWINSDDASELVLGKLLASENSIISPNWYYSTEIRFLNTNIFYSFFFHFFDHWHRVRIFSYISMYILLAIGYFFLCRRIKIQKYFFITCTLLFVSFCDDYFDFFLRTAYYLPYIIISFFTISFCEGYIDEKGIKKYLSLIFGIILALGAGLGGLRQIVVLYIPLLLAAIVYVGYRIIPDLKMGITSMYHVREKHTLDYFHFSLWAFFASFIGFLINNKLLSKIYHFQLWDNVSYCPFSIERFQKVLDGVFFSYGFSEGKLFSAHLAVNILCFIWLILTVIAIVYSFKKNREVPEEQFRLSLFIVCGIVVFTMIYTFSTMQFENRYNLMIIIFSFPLIASYIANTRVSDRLKEVVLFILVFLTILRGCYFNNQMLLHEYNKEFDGFPNILTESGYYEGYSTFWYANRLTELSDGKIEMWSWSNQRLEGTDLEKITDINQTYKWLQLVSHDTKHPEGKCFLLLSSKEYEHNNWTSNINKCDILYQSAEYVILGFESYEQLLYETGSIIQE